MSLERLVFLAHIDVDPTKTGICVGILRFHSNGLLVERHGLLIGGRGLLLLLPLLVDVTNRP